MNRSVGSYAALYRYLRGQIAAHLTPVDQANVFFFEAIHFTRMLPHRARIRPATAAVFYGQVARSLDRYVKAVRQLGYLRGRHLKHVD